MSEPLIETAARLFARRGERVAAVRAIAGGANSEALEIETAAGARRLLKRYPVRGEGDADRLGTEFAALTFLRANGVRCVPEPLWADAGERVGVFGFLEGARVPAEGVGAAEVRQACDLLRSLHALREAPGAAGLPAAREACFSLASHESLVRGRLARLRDGAIASGGEAGRLASFLCDSVRPHLEETAARVRREARRRGLDPEAELMPEARTLSPSDFGFHNALRRPEGTLQFVDFEYFGWDDPAKVVADFILQPQVPLPEALRPLFLREACSLYEPAADLGRRLPLVHALLACKWSLIALNVFLQPPAGALSADRRSRRLARAAMLLNRARRALEAGPFAIPRD